MASHKNKTEVGKDRFSTADIRKAMKAVNAKDSKHKSAVLVAKELGYDIENSKKAIRSLSARMRHALRTEA